MKRYAVLVSVITCLLGLAVEPATAQIRVEGGAGNNSFTNTTNPPLSGDMANSGDLFLQHDLELGGELYLNGQIYMQRQATGAPTSDQYIYFSRNGDRASERFGYDGITFLDFVSSEDLVIVDETNGQIRTEGGLWLEAEAPNMFFVVDADENDNAGTFPHEFAWFNNNILLASRAMTLRSTGPDPDLGNLTIAGTLTQNGFDLAEMFLAADSVQAGELVAVDDARPDAVRPAVAGDGGRILGIVATRPGVVLGGAAFSPEALRRQWGDDLAGEFERARPGLEAEFYAENPALRDQAAALASPGAFAADLERRSAARPQAVPSTRDDGSEVPRAGSSKTLWNEAELQEDYTAALNQHETRLFDAARDLFYERRFARVALAGRVPVKVDAAFGAIEAGDPLTASPVPGVAMRAEGAGWIVGTALEAMPSGSGTILAFVDRGWVGGNARGRLAELEDELETLKRALASLGLPGLEPRASLASR